MKLLCVAVLLALASCAPRVSQDAAEFRKLFVSSNTKLTGKASWYDVRHDGRRTASGIPLDDRKLTAAHKTLPFGTKVLVRCRETGATVTVTITDRGPYIKGRVIDLSRAAAHKLGIITKGLTQVDLCPM